MIRQLTIWMATPGLLLAEYKDYWKANPDYDTDFAAMIGDFVEYGKPRTDCSTLATNLKIPSVHEGASGRMIGTTAMPVPVMETAIKVARSKGVVRAVAIAPVGSAPTCEHIQRLADKCLCLLQNSDSCSLALWHDDPRYITDEKVQSLLAPHLQDEHVLQ
jgi:hypothetical protein